MAFRQRLPCKFQFTPLREGRHRQAGYPTACRRFQFTPLREGRRRSRETAEDSNQISIHAPPRGATERSSWATRNRPHFNSRPSARGDGGGALALNYGGGKFQFTPLREGRHSRSGTERRGNDFNSRPSARGDMLFPLLVKIGKQISIHAPPRGATAGRWRLAALLAFQFTPLREGRLAASESPGVGKISIHAPPRGATAALCALGYDCGISIHAPPRGATLSIPFYRSDLSISIHAPPRGATQVLLWEGRCL